MADATQHHCTRAWYFRPPVWIFGVLLLGLAAFGVMEIINRPAAIPYGDFFDQLDAGNVASVTFQGMQVTGHFKHAIAAPAAKGTAPQDVFRSQVPDIGDPALLPELRKEHVLIDVVSPRIGCPGLAGCPGRWCFSSPLSSSPGFSSSSAGD